MTPRTRDLRRARLSDALGSYLAARQPVLSKATIERYRNVGDYLTFHAGNIPTTALRPEHIDRYMAYLRGPHLDRQGYMQPPLSQTGYYSHGACLRPFLRWLRARRYTEWDLAGAVYIKAPPQRIRLRLDPRQVIAVLDNAPTPRERALLAVAYFTATRAAEIKSMTIGDLDLTRNKILIHVWKSDSEDELTICPELRTELDTWLAIYEADVEATLGRSLLPQDHLIPARQRHRIDRWETTNGLRHVIYTSGGPDPTRPVRHPHEIVQRGLRQLGIEERHEGIHTLRRTAARHIFDTLIEQAVYDSALRIVQSLLHHSTMETTERYIGLGTERLKRDEFLRTASLLAPYRKNGRPKQN